MLKETLQTIKKYDLLTKDMHIIIGLSGGPDSVCLFDVLCRLAAQKPELGLRLYALHVNHKLRPGAAEKDQRYVQELCQSRGVPCEVVTRDCGALASELGLSAEEAGRKVRYDAFSQAAAKLAAAAGIDRSRVAIALAHNANDQCETILFRILRGTGTDGLAGMAHKRYDKEGFAIIRPLLDTSREEIEEYCRARNLSPRIDHTNSENIYARNKIRNELLPLLAAGYNAGITEALTRLGRVASCDRDFLHRAACAAFEQALLKPPGAAAATSGFAAPAGGRQAAPELVFSTEILKTLHKAIRTRIYTMALERLGIEEGVSFVHLEALDGLLWSGRASCAADVSGGLRVRREYDRLVFTRPAPPGRQADWQFRQFDRAGFAKYRRSSDGGRLYGAFCGVEADKLEIRSRRAGDRIAIVSGGRIVAKKLQDFFVDEKLPLRYRDEVQLLAYGSNILWILPDERYERRQLREKGRFSASFRALEESEGPIIVLEKL